MGTPVLTTPQREEILNRRALTARPGMPACSRRTRQKALHFPSIRAIRPIRSHRLVMNSSPTTTTTPRGEAECQYAAHPSSLGRSGASRAPADPTNIEILRFPAGTPRRRGSRRSMADTLNPNQSHQAPIKLLTTTRRCSGICSWGRCGCRGLLSRALLGFWWAEPNGGAASHHPYKDGIPCGSLAGVTPGQH